MKAIIRHILVALTIVASTTVALPVIAESAENYGRKIVEEVTRRDEGFGDFTSDVTMVLKNAKGDAFERYLHVETLESDNDGDKHLFVFRKPRDIKGTAVLSHTHLNGHDDQWIYLPAFKRIKRISSATNSSAFVGSEFAYEDMTSVAGEKYRDR